MNTIKYFYYSYRALSFENIKIAQQMHAYYTFVY
jgi:hypothetical protein